jgi:2-methylisocitrate lyase-like PEP mutase family enzyme
MNQNEKAKRFAKLHVKGKPILLYNAWDAGSAKAILEAGAKAVATSSWSVAEAQGYRDGEAIPITLVEQIVARIASTIDAPVTIDFEGGYSEDEDELAKNVSRLIETGIVGINFEDRVVTRRPESSKSGNGDLQSFARDDSSLSLSCPPPWVA